MSERDNVQDLEDMAAAMFTAGSQASNVVGPSRTDPIAFEDASVDNGPIMPSSAVATRLGMQEIVRRGVSK